MLKNWMNYFFTLGEPLARCGLKVWMEPDYVCYVRGFSLNSCPMSCRLFVVCSAAREILSGIRLRRGQESNWAYFADADGVSSRYSVMKSFIRGEFLYLIMRLQTPEQGGAA